MRESIDEAQKIFGLPTCNRRFPDIGKGRPCLNFYIKQCCAPCRGKVSQKDYRELVNDALDFLKGGSSDCVQGLTKRMEEAAESLDFERAARIRDRLEAIRRLGKKQKVVAVKVPRQDVVALAVGPAAAVLRCFGSGWRLCDRETFCCRRLIGQGSPYGVY
ncbi:MAG: UvrB/UvrC motif-containing protein [[Clostridium] leptum]